MVNASRDFPEAYLNLRDLLVESNDEQEIFTLRSDSEINKYLNRQLSNTIDDARNFVNKVTLYLIFNSYLLNNKFVTPTMYVNKFKGVIIA